jgi:hypothetical protein
MVAGHGARPAPRARLGDGIARILGCAVAQADGDSVAHYLIEVLGKKPVDVRPPERSLGLLAQLEILPVEEFREKDATTAEYGQRRDRPGKSR